MQQAKGNPGRRKSKVAGRIEEAERVAKLLAASPGAGGGLLDPPALLEHPMAAAALKVWTEYAPELARTQRLNKTHREQFAMFCVYVGEWMTACVDIQENGYHQKVKTVAGGFMERIRPVVQWREIAFGRMRDLSQVFGLTPREEYALFRDQADAVTRNPGLFDQRGRSAPQPAEEATPEPTAKPSGLVGSLNSLDSAPPSGPPH